MKKISIYTEYITLGQMLKHINLVSSGGEVKYFLANNNVIINDVKDDRRGRKIYPGDRVTVLNQNYIVEKNEN
jgi:S4 domain protein YaaA